MNKELIAEIITDVVSVLFDLQQQIDDLKADIHPFSPLDNQFSERVLKQVGDKVELLLHSTQPHSSTQPPLQQAAVGRNEVAVCHRCGDEHSTTDCHGYCTAASMQEDEGAN